MTRVSSAPQFAPLVGAPLRMIPLAQVASNDPTQRVQFEGNGRLEFRIAGTASNTGTRASRLEIAFGARKLAVHLAGGMTPAETLRKLQEAMPRGFQAVLLRTWRHPGADVVAGIRTALASARRT